ncbi:MAG: response regulator [Eubacteriales bacterium]|nr:response regulator [Lachnospiraceae bacterium]MDO5126477.1 response regulator [Eubacteriales bacterium]
MAKILIVDDSRTSRRILRNILEEDGHTVVGEATNGKEGYEMYEALKPELVTMDITMPVMTGVESLKKIKEIDADAKVVMVSAAGQQHNMLEAVQSGAAEFISKPFDVNSIKNIINNLVEA